MTTTNRQTKRPPVRRPVLFLDFDDVLALNTTLGGYDVALALAPPAGEGNSDLSDLWRQLFDPEACEYLHRLHDEFVPQYVLSTTWWWILDDAALRDVLRRTGLEFVVRNLHPDSSTPKGSKPDLRWTEIKNWLEAHPQYSDRWVVLDDELSGTGLVVAEDDVRRPFIVLCAKDVGLTQVKYQQLRTAFLLRASIVADE